jgi:hypothetical protein
MLGEGAERPGRAAWVPVEAFCFEEMKRGHPDKTSRQDGGLSEGGNFFELVAHAAAFSISSSSSPGHRSHYSV